MKTSRNNFPERIAILALVTLLAVVVAGCSRRDAAQAQALPAERPSRPALDPLAVVLAPHHGGHRVDVQIREHQGMVRSNLQREAALERLGWLYVAKARDSFDAGFYTLAEQCGLALEGRRAGNAAALLLRGHALHSQHRFGEAGELARRLVASRGLAADYGLLGDVLIDVGRVDEAAQAYQAMLDFKPDPQGYARAAHLRWLKGDREGAAEVMRMAVAGSSPRDPGSAAWMHTQLARYLWQAGTTTEAGAWVDSALSLRSDYPPALLLRGRMLLAEGKPADAAVPLELAAKLNPLPEYQWALADAFRAANRAADAERVEREILARGPADDARGCALFLATRRQQPALALRLARQELAGRGDVFSHDAVAWALAASGDFTNATTHMRAALELGTPDPRLWLHAGVIAFHNGRRAESERWLRQAEDSRACLLPGECARLDEVKELLRATAMRVP